MPKNFKNLFFVSYAHPFNGVRITKKMLHFQIGINLFFFVLVFRNDTIFGKHYLNCQKNLFMNIWAVKINFNYHILMANSIFESFSLPFFKVKRTSLQGMRLYKHCPRESIFKTFISSALKVHLNIKDLR